MLRKRQQQQWCCWHWVPCAACGAWGAGTGRRAPRADSHPGLPHLKHVLPHHATPVLQVDAIVYLVDSADPDRFPESKRELDALLSDDSLAQVPVLVLGNKIDLMSAVSEEHLRWGGDRDARRRVGLVGGSTARRAAACRRRGLQVGGEEQREGRQLRCWTWASSACGVSGTACGLGLPACGSCAAARWGGAVLDGCPARVALQADVLWCGHQGRGSGPEAQQQWQPGSCSRSGASSLAGLCVGHS